MVESKSTDFFRKAISIPITEENEKVVSSQLLVFIQKKTNDIFISNIFRYCGRSIGVRNRSRRLSDNMSLFKTREEIDKGVRDRMEEVIKEDPSISEEEVKRRTGFSTYRTSVYYMMLKRKYLRKGKNGDRKVNKIENGNGELSYHE